MLESSMIINSIFYRLDKEIVMTLGYHYHLVSNKPHKKLSYNIHESSLESNVSISRLKQFKLACGSGR